MLSGRARMVSGQLAGGLAMLALTAAALSGGKAPAQPLTIERVNVDRFGAQALDFPATSPSVSGDGQRVSFTTFAALAADDANGTADVYVKDRADGSLTRVSVASDGSEGVQASDSSAVSRNGRFVAFVSANSFVGMLNGELAAQPQVWVRDLQTGVTEPVSLNLAGGYTQGSCSEPSISADGRFVAFVCTGADLTTGDANNLGDAFVRDRATGVTELVSLGVMGQQGTGLANASCYRPVLSDDGRFVAFSTDFSNLWPNDTNSRVDAFLRDRQSGATQVLSLNVNGAAANGRAMVQGISADGQRVVFFSDASTLVAGDTNGLTDVFVRDRAAAQARRVSVNRLGQQGTNVSFSGAISGDGRFVAFASRATNLVVGDTNVRDDVFVHDLSSGLTERVSVNGSTQGNGPSGFYGVAVDSSGGAIVFTSAADNFVPTDTNGQEDVFLVGYVAGAPNQPPTADAGLDQSVAIPHDGNPATAVAAVTLFGSGVDPENDPVTFEWRDASGTVLGRTATLNTSLPAGLNLLTLRVSDPAGLFGEDTVFVDVASEPNEAPSANAGPDLLLETTGPPISVPLSSSGSSDPENDSLTFEWTEGGFLIASGAAPTALFALGTHVVVLTVRDAYGATATDELVIQIDQRASFRLAGTVTLGGSGLGGVLVSLLGTSLATVTDANGRYEFAALPAGNYAVVPDLPGFLFQPSAAAVNLTADTTQNFTANGAGGSARKLSVRVKFKKTAVGTSRTQALKLTNSGRTPLTIIVRETPPAPFALSAMGQQFVAGLRITIPPLGTLPVTGVFSPTAPGTVTRTFGLLTSDPATPVAEVSLSGQGF